MNQKISEYCRKEVRKYLDGDWEKFLEYTNKAIKIYLEGE